MTSPRSVSRMGFFTEAGSIAAGVIACTGNRGCKYAAADTKAHAVEIIKKLDAKLRLDMRTEILETRKQSTFSRRLLEAVGERLASGEQVMLLHNRRGFSTFVAASSVQRVSSFG